MLWGVWQQKYDAKLWHDKGTREQACLLDLIDLYHTAPLHLYSYWHLTNVFSLQLRGICCQKTLSNYRTSSKGSWLWLTLWLDPKVKWLTLPLAPSCSFMSCVCDTCSKSSYFLASFCRKLFRAIQSEAAKKRSDTERWAEASPPLVPVCRWHGDGQRGHLQV